MIPLDYHTSETRSYIERTVNGLNVHDDDIHFLHWMMTTESLMTHNNIFYAIIIFNVVSVSLKLDTTVELNEQQMYFRIIFGLQRINVFFK